MLGEERSALARAEIDVGPVDPPVLEALLDRRCDLPEQGLAVLLLLAEEGVKLAQLIIDEIEPVGLASAKPKYE